MSTNGDYRSRLPLTLGVVLITPGALEALRRNSTNGLEYIIRHASGDWGDVDAGDAQLNNDALIHESRVLSSYSLRDGTRIWIITEADRESTTILLPTEY